VDEISNVEPKDVNDLKASGKYYGTICELSSLAFSTIGDSVHPNSPFADIRVRRAIEHAVDKKALADAFTYGLGKVCNQFAAPGSWGYNPDVTGYPYNPDKAKQLLAEAGYSNGFKTKIITLPMAFYAYPPTAVQGYLGKVGVVAEIETAPPPKWQQTNLGGWESALFVHNGTLIDPDATRNLATNFSSKSILSISMLRPAELNEASVKAQGAGDFETKKKWTWEAQKLLIDKYALVNYFFTQPRITFLYNRVHNTGIGVTIDAHWTPENAWME
jgi:ABC-type transport system substrate-binding protein